MFLYILIGIAIFGGLFYFFLRKSSEKAVVISDVPDTPVGFGYKNMWLAARTTDKTKLAGQLGLKNVQEANWQTGVDAAYDTRVFITPAIDGWTLAIGKDLPTPESDEGKELLKKLSTAFGECQLFATHRVSDYHAWALARNGEVQRVFSIGDNVILEKLGEETAIEQQLNFVNPASEEAQEEGYWDRDDITSINEETAMLVAGNWSVDPTTLEERAGLEGLGLVGKL